MLKVGLRAKMICSPQIYIIGKVVFKYLYLFIFFFFFICFYSLQNITKTCLFKYIENFTTKNWKFSDKNSDIFFQISAQNIGCGYSLELPHNLFLQKQEK